MVYLQILFGSVQDFVFNNFVDIVGGDLFIFIWIVIYYFVDMQVIVLVIQFMYYVDV